MRSRGAVIALLRVHRACLPDQPIWDLSDQKIIRWIFIDREGNHGLRLTWTGYGMLRLVVEEYQFVLCQPRIIDIVRLGHRMRTPYYVAEKLLVVFDPDEAALLHLLDANLTAFVGFGGE
jgi:hypothetical protein